MQTADQQLSDQRDALDERMKRLAEGLLKKRDEAVAHRSASGIERKWREAQRAFDGIDGTSGKADMLDFATGEAWLGKSGQQARRSKVIVNIIRGKCETAEGRFTEIQFPSDENNWGLVNSRVPEASMPIAQPSGLVAQAMPQAPMPAAPGMPPAQAMAGQPMPAAPADPKEQQKADLEKRREAMENEIEDQHEESGFNQECRKVARSAIRLGTGVLKGVLVVKRVSSVWIEQKSSDGSSVHVLKVVENMKPASESRDIWNIYPDPHCGSDAKRGAYIWDKDYILPREVKNLAGVPGYSKRQLQKVLESQPVRTQVTIDKGNNSKTTASLIEAGAPYEKWEYYGDVDREDMLAMGCDCPEELGNTISAVVVFINEIPVKAVQNMLDTGGLPFDFFKWVEIDDDSPWGMGEPLKIIWQQRIITAAWRAMMDNAGDSSGSMLVLGKDVEPEDGIWEVTGKKIWLNNSDDGDVRNAFAQFQMANNQQELANIIQLALKFTDLESGTPALAQGEKGSSPETLGGMKLLMDGADTTRRRQVKQWDDTITRPHIKRYVDWNMQYNPKPEIKGDFEVNARGTSVLLVKDQTAQSLLQILSLRADPEVNLQVDWGKAIRQLFQARHLDVLKSEAEVEAARARQAQQPQQQAPNVQAAQIRADAQIKVEEMQAKELADHAVARAHMDLQQQNFDATEKEKDRQIELMAMQIQERLESMKEGMQKEISLNDLKAMLAATSMKLNVTKDLAVADHTMDLHKHRNPKPMAPVIEPPGRAPNGRAFQA